MNPSNFVDPNLRSSFVQAYSASPGDESNPSLDYSSTVAIMERQDLQSSLTLDSNVIATGFANDGQDQPEQGQVGSLTSLNNFINFCLTTPNLPLTNGKQVTTGSCNPAPMGILPSVDKLPSTKFLFPRNGGVLPEISFTVSLAVKNFDSGFFTNIEENFLSAPQILNSDGLVQGYYSVVIEALSDLGQKTPTDPKVFATWQAIKSRADSGILTTDIIGLPPGAYRITATVHGSNHQPIFSPIHAHEIFGDAVYFTVIPNPNYIVTASSESQVVQSTTATIDTTVDNTVDTTWATNASPLVTGGYSEFASSNSEVNTGTVVGSVILGLTLSSLFIFLFLRYRRQNRRLSETTSSINSPRPGPISLLAKTFKSLPFLKRDIISSFVELPEGNYPSSPSEMTMTSPGVDIVYPRQTRTHRSRVLTSDATLLDLDPAASRRVTPRPRTLSDATLLDMDVEVAANGATYFKVLSPTNRMPFVSPTQLQSLSIQPNALHSARNTVSDSHWSLRPNSANSSSLGELPYSLHISQPSSNASDTTRTGSSRQAVVGSNLSDVTLKDGVFGSSKQGKNLDWKSIPSLSPPRPDSNRSWSSLSSVPSYHTNA